MFHVQSKNRRRHSRKTEPESEESESDQDQLTSSRTESSNQHEGKIKHSKSGMGKVQYIILLYLKRIIRKSHAFWFICSERPLKTEILLMLYMLYRDSFHCRRPLF